MMSPAKESDDSTLRFQGRKKAKRPILPDLLSRMSHAGLQSFTGSLDGNRQDEDLATPKNCSA